jgi:hypothetical protein
MFCALNFYAFMYHRFLLMCYVYLITRVHNVLLIDNRLISDAILEKEHVKVWNRCVCLLGERAI